VCGEKHSYKTCSQCDANNDALGGNTLFLCRSLSGRFDRNVNAADNIFIKKWQMLQWPCPSP